ncbi:hypothetical protein An14g05060 [Aspergillus niger]|uniref:Uncharacterized protein n=2 Tax=Aspergillus niger TaxID=5061 RepID=A2R3P9_ASPNC|nr:hypothetical protein An14g05060 [Aspergillus niger]CAK42067.1 hypothetical protein An14g05060 [Aspergillus niger]
MSGMVCTIEGDELVSELGGLNSPSAKHHECCVFMSPRVMGTRKLILQEAA